MSQRQTRSSDSFRRPHRLVIYPEEGEVHEIDNGTMPRFGAKVLDKCDNVIKPTIDDKYAIQVQLFERKTARRLQPMPGSYILDIMHGPDGKLVSLKGGPNVKLDLEDNDEKIVVAKFSLKNFRSVDPVEREITVKRAQQPVKIRLFAKSEFDREIDIEITNRIEWTAGGFIEDIRFELYDQDDKKVTKSNLSSTNMTISWRKEPYVQRFTDDQLNEGRLPRVKAPNNCSDNFFSVAYHDTLSLTSRLDAHTVEFSFLVIGRPGPARKITHSFERGNKRIMAGQVFNDVLLVKIVDRFGNGISSITDESLQELQVSCLSNPLDEVLLKKSVGEQEGVIRVEGIKFTRPILGPAVINLQFNDIKATAQLEVITGLPKAIDWELSLVRKESGDEATVSINKNQTIRMGLQLYDEFGNKVSVEDIPVNLGVHRSLEMKPDVKKMQTNESGLADFGRVMVGLKNDCEAKLCPMDICDGLCYGLYIVRAKAVIDGVDILSPNLKLHVTCDTDKPSKFVVGCTSTVLEDQTVEGEFVVNQKFPFFKVKLVAENGSEIEDLNEEDVVMRSWLAGVHTCINIAELNATSYEDNHWVFDLFAPHAAGLYNIMFAYKIGGSILVESKIFKVKLIHDVPAVLLPNRTLRAYVVSNTKNKKIIDQLELDLYDRYFNIVHLDDQEDKSLDGTVKFEIVPTEKEITAIPKFIGNVDTIELPLERGKCKIDKIRIEEKTEGIDGKLYILRAIPIVEALSELKPFEIKFQFRNDREKEDRLNEMQNEAKKILERRKNLEAERMIILRKLDEFKVRRINEHNKRKSLLEKWRKDGYSFAFSIKDNVTSEEINTIKEARSEELERLLQEDKKRLGMQVASNIAEAPDEEDVLGKVCHLAQLEDPQEAFVISWHLQADMDTIVTMTSKKAKELDKRFEHKQQLLPLDGIHRDLISRDLNNQLPHARTIHDIEVRGNPVYAKHLLKFSKEPKHCNEVFSVLLGDTLLMDSIDNALHYRTQLVKYTSCPTIITRDGRRLCGNGKFGGTGNQAPANQEALKFGMFALAPSKKITQLEETVGKLELLLSSTVKIEEISIALEECFEANRETLEKFDKELEAIYREQEECDRRIFDEQHGTNFSQVSRVTQKRRASEVLEEDPVPKRANGSSLDDGKSPISRNDHNIDNSVIEEES